MHKQDFAIGIDFGGVIVRQSDGNRPIDASADASICFEHCFEGIAYLNAHFKGNVHIVSKASRSTAVSMRQWLNQVGFYQKTGLLAGNVHICRKRHEKVPIAKDLGLSHFVDDNIDTLQLMIGIVPKLFHFGGSVENSEILPVKNWREIERQCKEM